MAEISPSAVNAQIPLAVQAPKIDMLGLVGQANQAKQGLLNNRLLEQQIGGKEALGRAITGAYDPETGKVDFDKAQANLAQDPTGAFALPDFSAQVIARHLAEKQLGKADLELGLQQSKAISDTVAPLLSTPTPLTRDQVIGAMRDRLVKSGLFHDPASIQLFTNFAANLPQDDAGIRAMLKSAGMAANMTAEGIGLYQGAPQNVDTGPRIVTQQVSPLTGERRVLGAMDKGLTPSEGAELVDVIASDGSHYKVPKATLLGGGVAPSGGSPPSGTGRYPGGAPGTGGAGGIPGAVAQSGLAPGAPEAMAESYKIFQADQAAVPDLRKTLTTFDQAYQAIKGAKTGPGSEWLQNLRGIADTYGIPLPPGVGNKDQTVAYAEANKWLTSAITTEAKRLGLGTDQARALQQEAQPGAHTVHDAAVAMIPVLKGLKAMDVAAPLIAQKEGVSPQQYVQWRANWANSVDPLAFGADLMPAAQRKAIIDKMKPDEKARYAQGIKAAVKAGLYTYDDLR